MIHTVRQIEKLRAASQCESPIKTKGAVALTACAQARVFRPQARSEAAHQIAGERQRFGVPILQLALTAAWVLGSTLSDRGSRAEGEKLLLDTLKRHQHVLGPKHPDTLYILVNLGAHYQEHSDYAAAEPLYEQAIEGLEAALGRSNFETQNVIQNLAGVYENTGRRIEAEALYAEGLRETRAAVGDAHWWTITLFERAISCCAETAGFATALVAGVWPARAAASETSSAVRKGDFAARTMVWFAILPP